jgi:hypothetical protein
VLETFTCWSCDPEDTKEYECFDAETAAEKYAESKFQQDFDVGYVQGLDIHVRGRRETQKFIVDVQMEPRFYATEIYLVGG